jgi:hypothetical protein
MRLDMFWELKVKMPGFIPYANITFIADGKCVCRMFKVQWLLYIPSGLIIKITTFCPHSAYNCCVEVWEHTAYISLYSIKWLVFITQSECVYSKNNLNLELILSLKRLNLILQVPSFLTWVKYVVHTQICTTIYHIHLACHHQ